MPYHSTKLNVLQIILDLDRAGAQEVVRTLSKYLQTGDCTVTVCTFRDGPLRDEIENLGIKVAILKHLRYSIMIFPMWLAELWRIRRELVHLIKTNDIDIVQTHLLDKLDFLVLTLRYKTNLRVVLWTVHNAKVLGTKMHRLKKFARRLLYRWTASNVDGIIAVSDEVRK
jgi:hypothetical protein